jgi:hypothetical protein
MAFLSETIPRDLASTRVVTYQLQFGAGALLRGLPDHPGPAKPGVAWSY